MTFSLHLTNMSKTFIFGEHVSYIFKRLDMCNAFEFRSVGKNQVPWSNRQMLPVSYDNNIKFRISHFIIIYTVVSTSCLCKVSSGYGCVLQVTKSENENFILKI